MLQIADFTLYPDISICRNFSTFLFCNDKPLQREHGYLNLAFSFKFVWYLVAKIQLATYNILQLFIAFVTLTFSLSVKKNTTQYCLYFLLIFLSSLSGFSFLKSQSLVSSHHVVGFATFLFYDFSLAKSENSNLKPIIINYLLNSEQDFLGLFGAETFTKFTVVSLSLLKRQYKAIFPKHNKCCTVCAQTACMVFRQVSSFCCIWIKKVISLIIFFQD